MSAVLRIGSLFSGIGGLELGVLTALRTLGVAAHVAWQAERNPYKRAVLRKHWPGTPCYEDVRDVEADAPPVDLVVGGFPCQDISPMGLRAGLGGRRSGLWREHVRVLRVVRPGATLVENVPELAAHLGGVLGPLADLGFDAEWGVFSAAADGAPHLRRRLFLLAFRPELAHAHGDRREGGRGAGEGAPLAAAEGGGALPDAAVVGRRSGTGVGEGEAGRAKPADLRQWPPEPRVGRVVDGVSSRLDSRRRRARLAALGDAVVGPTAARALLTLAALAGVDLTRGRGCG